MFDWEEKPELNVTPLVDVMLVLLAILMATMPVLVFEENIVLPSGTKQSIIKNHPDLEIWINKDGVIGFKNNKYTLENFADNFILITNSLPKETAVYIKADKRLFYGDVLFVMKSIKEAGFYKIALETAG